MAVLIPSEGAAIADKTALSACLFVPLREYIVRQPSKLLKNARGEEYSIELAKRTSVSLLIQPGGTRVNIDLKSRTEKACEGTLSILSA